MRNMVDIDVVLDENYQDPNVTIRTKENTKQVENIVYAIENASDNDFPVIVGYTEKGPAFISQRDILRIHTVGRRILLETEGEEYYLKKSLSSLEEDLNSERFFRISQSEIINLYKVKGFDVNISGTIGVEFENGVKTWASRSRVKDIKELLKRLSSPGAKERE